LASQGKKVVKDGKTLETEEENITHLKTVYEEFRLFWFLCGNEVYTDSFFDKIVLKVLPDKHFTIP
jgi:hypothetical protein